MDNAAVENWDVLLSLLPLGWEQQAVLCGAVERLRGFRSTGELLRVLLMHVGLGYSLRETVVRARQAGLAQVSDVALMLRLRNSEQWWRQLCVGLLEESGWSIGADPRRWNVRALDGTIVREPGRTGTQWRIHYSLRLPSLECDCFEITAAKGRGTGEKLERLAVAPGDLILADRGFCRPAGVASVARQQAALVVRLHGVSLPLYQPNGRRLALLETLRQWTAAGPVGEWPVRVRDPHGGMIDGRLCALRKSEQAARRSQRRTQRKAENNGRSARPESLELAAYVAIFTTLPAAEFPAAEVVELYRGRWQIELAFKRLKSLAQLGHLPKYEPHTARAWLYGKLLLALLTQKLARHGREFSPWGYALAALPAQQRMAAV